MLNIGSVLEGKYRIERQIGSGGMSNVYICRNIRSNREWVVKEAKQDVGDSVQSLAAEASIMKKLRHPGLPEIIDIIEDNDRFLIVMEYVPGQSLKDIVDQRGAQQESDIIEWAKQLCNVFGYLHSQRPPIVYRDLKPANIMLKPDGTIALIDFGTAREYKSSSIEDTVCLGTRGYAAPEQYGGHGQTDARTDIYTLGATLYHLATGYHPQDTPTEFPMVRRLNPNISEGLEGIIAKCVQTNINLRYQNCGELYADLDKLSRTTGTTQTIVKAAFGACAAAGVVFLIMAIRFMFSNVALDLAGIILLAAALFIALKFRIFNGSLTQDLNLPHPQGAMLDGTGMQMGTGTISSGDGTGSTSLSGGAAASNERVTAAGLIIEDELIFLASKEIIGM